LIDFRVLGRTEVNTGITESGRPTRIIHGKRLAIIPGTRLGPHEIVFALGADELTHNLAALT
jgi:hypothetical protein